MRYLRQSTAVEVKVGPFVDSTDGNTQETALTISQADVRLAKNGGDWAQKNETTTLVHEEAGWYRCLLDATDTNTVGILMLAIHESGALPVWVEFHVLEEAIYDALFEAAATGALPVSSGGITTASFAAGAINAAAIATDAIAAAKISSGAVAEIADAVWDELVAGHVGAGSVGERVERLDVIASGGSGALTNARAALLDNLDAAVTSRASQASLDTVDDLLDTEVAAIKAKTDLLPADPADQSAVEAAILAAWTTQLTEAYAADGVAPTPAQMMFMLWAAIAEFAISGTTITAKKLDGSTAAMTFTLDDATNPTSRTRAS